MPDRKTELRKAAVERSKARRERIPARSCEDCGAAVNKLHDSFDPVKCWRCLEALNQGTPRGDAA